MQNAVLLDDGLLIVNVDFMLQHFLAVYIEGNFRLAHTLLQKYKGLEGFVFSDERHLV